MLKLLVLKLQSAATLKSVYCSFNCSIGINLNESLSSVQRIGMNTWTFDKAFMITSIYFYHAFLLYCQPRTTYFFYTKHIHRYVQNDVRVSCSKKLIYERFVMIYYSLNVYPLHTWPLSSRADSHHYNTPLFCDSSQRGHKSCCNFVDSSLRIPLLNTLKEIK